MNDGISKLTESIDDGEFSIDYVGVGEGKGRTNVLGSGGAG